MLRKRISVLVTSFAVLASGLTFGATPASAAISGAGIDPSTWAAGSTVDTLVTWTESDATANNGTSQATYAAGGQYLSVEVGWGWTMANKNPSNTAVPYIASWDAGRKAYSCATTPPIVFSSPGFGGAGDGPIECLVRRSSDNQNEPSDPGQQVVLSNAGGNYFTLTAGSTITVAFAGGQVTAPAAGPAADTWRIISLAYGGGSTTGKTTTVRTVVPGPDGAVLPPPPQVRLDFNGNGGVCTPSFVEGDQGTWSTALTADQCTNGTKKLAFFSTSPTAAIGAGNVLPGGPIYFLTDNRFYAVWQSEAPSPPTNVVATPGLNSVSVSWTASASDGGDPIRGYNVRFKAATDTNFSTFCNTNAATFQCAAALPATNTQYTFVVSAANQVGRAESAPSSPVSPYTIRNVTASRSDVLFGLGGTKVQANGAAPGLAGQSLNVQFKVGSAQEWTTLTNAAKVNAEARFSWSRKFPASANKKVVTVRFTYGTDSVSGTYALSRGGEAGDLSAPRNIKANGELNKVTLTWNPPKFDGGAKIIGYTICAEFIGTLCRDAGLAGQSDFRNLVPGNSYSFTVAARTAAQAGPKAKANKKARFTEASVRIAAREPGQITILAEGRGFPDTNKVRLDVAIVPTTNQPRDRWRWDGIETFAAGNRFSKTVEAELNSGYNDKFIVVRLITPLGSVYSRGSRP